MTLQPDVISDKSKASNELFFHEKVMEPTPCSSSKAARVFFLEKVTLSRIVASQFDKMGKALD